MRHVAAAVPGELRPQERLDLGVADHRDAEQRGEGVARDVVLGRTEPAGHEHDVGAAERDAAGPRRSASRLSPTAWWCSTSTPIVGEPLGDPLRVRVRDLTEQQLGADPDELGPHPLTADGRRGLAARGRPRVEAERLAPTAGPAMPGMPMSTPFTVRRHAAAVGDADHERGRRPRTTAPRPAASVIRRRRAVDRDGHRPSSPVRHDAPRRSRRSSGPAAAPPWAARPAPGAERCRETSPNTTATTRTRAGQQHHEPLVVAEPRGRHGPLDAAEPSAGGGGRRGRLGVPRVSPTTLSGVSPRYWA